MVKLEKNLERVLRGNSDASIPFGDLCQLLKNFGFELRVRGSHHIFWKEGVVEILNIQSKSGKAKPYQVKQVRNIIVKYKLGDRGLE